MIYLIEFVASAVFAVVAACLIDIQQRKELPRGVRDAQEAIVRRWPEFVLALGSFLLSFWVQHVYNWIVTPSIGKYPFEAPGEVVAWRVPSKEECAEKRGCAFLSRDQSETYHYDGDASLSVDVELHGRKKKKAEEKETEETKAEYSQGEIFVNVKSTPPRGYPVGEPLNLFLQDVTAIVNVPDSLISKYVDTAPSYLQLFFEICGREGGRIDGGLGEKVEGVGPVRLAYRVWSRAEICRIGVKMGLNDQDDGVYRGTIYIDAIDWERLEWWWPILLGVVLTLVAMALLHMKRTRRTGGTPGEPDGSATPPIEGSRTAAK